MTSTTQLKPFHYTSMRKALNALLIDHAAGKTESGGWCDGWSVGGWRTADQLVTLNLFELSPNSKKRDLDSRRYRILPSGIAYLVKLFDVIKFKVTNAPATLLTISDTSYRFYVEYRDASANMIKEWHNIGEFDLSHYTAEWQPEQRRVINALMTNQKSPYAAVEIEGDEEAEDETSAVPIPPRQSDAVEAAHERLAADIRNTPERDEITERGANAFINIIMQDAALRGLASEEQIKTVADAISGTTADSPPPFTGEGREGVDHLRNRIKELETLLKLERAGQAVVEAVEIPVEQPDKVEVIYFNERISREEDERRAKNTLEKLLNTDGYIIVHEQFVVIEFGIWHVARLEREAHSSDDAAASHPVDFDLALDDARESLALEGLSR